MGDITAGNDERGDIELEQIFRFSSRSSIPIEQRTADAGHDGAILLHVLPRIGLCEGRVIADDRGPWSTSRIGAERLAFRPHKRDNLFQALPLDERQMRREAL